MSEEEILLKVENIFSGYGEKIVLEDITFQMKKGEFLGIIGPNGVGKIRSFKDSVENYSLFKGKDVLSG